MKEGDSESKRERQNQENMKCLKWGEGDRCRGASDKAYCTGRQVQVGLG